MFLNLSFIALFFVILWLKSPWYLLACALIFNAVAFKNCIKINKKVLKSILIFNIGVSLGYIVMAFFKEISPWNYVIYINLKVYTLTFFVFLFFSHVSIVNFFSFSKELSYLLSISLSQIYSYRKTFEDFRLSYKARFIKNYKERKRDFITVVFSFFLKKSMHDSHERVLAMRARGFFD
ncbi:hypothetical protein [Sulfurospirillum sp. 1612]|uniref:hypothetical protein n=1 Tax=Sulfurospirillum sp. 1612 TaxID=3094835 RepID=UPI002F94F7A9